MYTQTQINAAADALRFLREKKAQTIFAAEAPGLIAKGYPPLPRKIEGSHGRPAIDAWSDWCEKLPSEKEIAAWSKIKGADISLACGFGGLVAIDVDDDRPEILAAVRKVLPHCTVARRGSKGFVLFVRRVDGPQKTINVSRAEEARKDPLVEIMGPGRSIAIPPSTHHKTGKPYRWIDPATMKPRPDDWQLPALADLPVVTAADIERLIAALTPWSRKPKPPRPKAEGPAPVLNDAYAKRLRRYAMAGLEKATAGLATLREGRPSELFRAVCGLGWAVAHHIVTEAELTNAFIAACEANGLAARDGRRAIEASILSGLQWSEHDPLPQLEDSDPAPKASAAGNAAGDRADGGAKNAKNGEGAATSATPATFQDEPLPLFRELPKSEPFPVEALGATLGGMAKALNEAAVQSPMAIWCSEASCHSSG